MGILFRNRLAFMTPALLAVISSLGAGSRCAIAAPAPEQLWIHKTTRECFVYWPGDEHMSFDLRLPNRTEWSQFHPSFFSQDILITTSFGTCKRDPEGKKRLLECCKELALLPVSDPQTRGWVVPLPRRTGNPPATVNTSQPKASVEPKTEDLLTILSTSAGKILALVVTILLLATGWKRLFKKRERSGKSDNGLLMGIVGFLLSLSYVIGGFALGFKHAWTTLPNRDSLAPLVVGMVYGGIGAIVCGLFSFLIKFLSQKCESQRAKWIWLAAGFALLALLALLVLVDAS